MSEPIFASAPGPTAPIVVDPGQSRPTVRVDLSPDAPWPFRYHIEVTNDPPDGFGTWTTSPRWRPYGIAADLAANPPGLTTSCWFPLMEDATALRAVITTYTTGTLQLRVEPAS